MIKESVGFDIIINFFFYTIKTHFQHIKMDTEQFRSFGKEMIDYICDYTETIGDRDVAPTLDPGYLKKLIPSK